MAVSLHVVAELPAAFDKWDMGTVISSGKVNLYRCNNKAMTIFVSNNAKCCPKQFRGPAMNGKNVYGAMSFHDLVAVSFRWLLLSLLPLLLVLFATARAVVVLQ